MCFCALILFSSFGSSFICFFILSLYLHFCYWFWLSISEMFILLLLSTFQLIHAWKDWAFFKWHDNSFHFFSFALNLQRLRGCTVSKNDLCSNSQLYLDTAIDLVLALIFRPAWLTHFSVDISVDEVPL